MSILCRPKQAPAIDLLKPRRRHLSQARSKPYHLEPVELLFELEKLSSPDSRVAEEALYRIRPTIERHLVGYLRGWQISGDDLDDVKAGTITNIWKARGGLTFRSEGEWWRYVFTTAKRLTLAKLKEPKPGPLETDISEAEAAVVDIVVRHRDRLYQAADELWLGRAPGVDESEWRKRILAVQFFYLHGLPWDAVAEIAGLKPSDRAQLDAWLLQVCNLLGTAFTILCLPNAKLVEMLLESSGQNWTEAERRIVALRYGNGLRTEKILQMEPSLSGALVEETVRRCREFLPFTASALEMRDAFSKVPRQEAAFSAPDLWKRLVFQYCYQFELPQKQIMERTEPPAGVFGYRLTEGTLNMWTSGERLSGQLAKYLKRGNP
ncbi:sigma-70 family RNA polymerase sigma factor [Fimbriimonas ginsengisoli]|uniref:Uncharacterized protein n=1 Tax=Fimbriimonas ginsengisoli Gsoil 348 TaxID=661478 RepID=A0A068NR00_FIMGI|nr:sigma-70 family RNA polymerase sigma factor [Fimbriimonas ginsengisoli]AIE85866.1 hypothetical protein OP10G_2498 [Fimbriimonas ginsengisoli Gsoil 348]